MARSVIPSMNTALPSPRVVHPAQPFAIPNRTIIRPARAPRSVQVSEREREGSQLVIISEH